MSYKNITVALCVVILVLSFVLMLPHKNIPPKFQLKEQVWPSCSWSGTQDQNDWQVSFSIIDWENNKKIWTQWVAVGLSEDAAAKLCDAYVQAGQ